MDSPPLIGLVMSGGGARGAYDAGVMSVLAPELEARGECPNIFIGTSVGAINAAFFAAACHLGADRATEVALDHWSEVRKGRIVRPILYRQAPLTLLRYAGEILSLPGVRLPSLLDPKPFEHQLERWIDWDAVHDNVHEGRLDSVAAVATGARTGRTVVFVEGHGERITHRSHAIDYVRTRLDSNHVRASAAIPILFPPVRIDAPRDARGWYFDGGTRMNTPIKPALDLGADRLVVIATDSVAEPADRARRGGEEPPDFGDGALHVLQGMLVDPVVEDLRILGNVNTFFAGGEGSKGGKGVNGGNGGGRSRARAGAGRARGGAAGVRTAAVAPVPSVSATRYREARGKAPYRVVPYIFVAPARRGAIGRLATEVFRERYGGLKGLRSPDFPFLNRLLGGDSPTHGELLSYLFFDQDFIAELIRMGRNDARRWMKADRGPLGPWQVEPLDVFTQPNGRRQTG